MKFDGLIASRRAVWLFALGGGILLPWVIEGHFFIFFLVNVFIFAMLSLGLQLLVGSAGILSLGHAGFFGIGAYASAILTSKYGVPFAVALPVSGLLAGIGGLIMAPIIRLHGVYFAMASFAFGIVICEVFANWKGLTGGHDGLSMIPSATIGPVVFDSPERFYYLALSMLVMQYAGLRYLLDSPFGRALNAMRQNENAVKSVGINPTSLKLWVIVLGAITAGIAGSLYAHFNGSVSPQMFRWSQSVTLLTIVVVGGMQSMRGVLVGTFALMFISEYARVFSQYSALFNGLLLVFFMVFLPRGLAGAAWEGCQTVREKVLRRASLRHPSSKDSSRT